MSTQTVLFGMAHQVTLVRQVAAVVARELDKYAFSQSDELGHKGDNRGLDVYPTSLKGDPLASVHDIDGSDVWQIHSIRWAEAE